MNWQEEARRQAIEENRIKEFSINNLEKFWKRLVAQNERLPAEIRLKLEGSYDYRLKETFYHALRRERGSVYFNPEHFRIYIHIAQQRSVDTIFINSSFDPGRFYIYCHLEGGVRYYQIYESDAENILRLCITQENFQDLGMHEVRLADVQAYDSVLFKK